MMDNIISSIASAIQAIPVKIDKLNWNFPNPSCSTASSIVYVCPCSFGPAWISLIGQMVYYYFYLDSIFCLLWLVIFWVFRVGWIFYFDFIHYYRDSGSLNLIIFYELLFYNIMSHKWWFTPQEGTGVMNLTRVEIRNWENWIDDCILVPFKTLK